MVEESRADVVNGLEQLARHSMKPPKHLPGVDLSTTDQDDSINAAAESAAA